ncbi:transglutaminase domain protein [Cellulomonas flavigena DSM 20109]|uniref:Transglutaminase domain protein n=1 Tax=Cellulomonas flavigena (strain ATCC 482 / DSM 20109 / BCRC 11376 / JCM 18109 / NBRC 3775 / NCIMB 8073 / NRS 134) TaxID=446466 RepID=D5UGL2_CELFN|nr:transglutaminase family protein [Cellulomonas flavigena]ADG75110.1 transglutaminase domain protein [Cellulomonas flavigena DSM 20109]
MSRLRIVHTSSFRYASPVVASYNEARMTPLAQPGQSVLESRLDLHPHTWSHDYRDYWGTQVTAFEVLAPHQSLLLTAEHVVEVVERPAPLTSVGWDVLHGAEVRDRLSEQLADTATTEVPDEVVELARRAADGLAPAEAAEAVCHALRDAVEYIPGVTTVHTPAAEAWAKRTGVCQDMAHLALGALRAIGIPARYVSGYLHPDASAEVGTTVTGESHAWIEWWTGEWYGYDPTNRVRAGDHHVVLGRGRSYDDVPPLRGIYAGPQTQDLVVQVRITREA